MWDPKRHINICTFVLMPFRSVNIEKSIRCKWLIPQFSWNSFFNYLLTSFLGLVLIFVSIAVNLNPKNHYSLFLTIFFYVFAAFFLLNLLLLNSLTPINGFNKDSNRVVITTVLANYFDLTKLTIGDGVIKNFKAPNGLIPGRMIVIVFDGENAYINVTSILGSRRIISPYHGLYNFILCKLIAKDFKKGLKSSF